MSNHVSKNLNAKQRQYLTVALVLVIAASLYFFRDYFYLIALSAIIAYIFNPLYKWLLRKSGGRSGFALTMTFILSLIIIAVPLGVIIAITVDQAISFINDITVSISSGTGIGNYLQNILDSFNNLLNRLPGDGDRSVTTSQIFNWLTGNANSLVSYSVGFFAALPGGITSFFTKAVIYVFVFFSFLRNQEKIVYLLRKLNPLGEQSTNLYLAKMKLMTSAMVKGQFVIALVQGLIDAALFWIVGVDYFFLWLVLVTFLSIIPLGGGVLVIPVGIIMLLTGNIWQGVVLIAGHILIVTNIDNILRPRFVPKKARLDPALVVLSVFAGIAMFGFLGIVIGPVLMILIVTTIKVYVAAVDVEEKRRLVAETKSVND